MTPTEAWKGPTREWVSREDTLLGLLSNQWQATADLRNQCGYCHDVAASALRRLRRDGRAESQFNRVEGKKIIYWRLA